MRLTKKRLEGLELCIGELEMLATAGWEGTPHECRDDDCGGPKKCERCASKYLIEQGLSWLNSFIDKKKSAQKSNPAPP